MRERDIVREIMRDGKRYYRCEGQIMIYISLDATIKNISLEHLQPITTVEAIKIEPVLRRSAVGAQVSFCSN